mmetsp:Transcript_43473/g.130416  ORF Transcript_43473/g.130416 Transcript_43473/m.130416 type:complete len:299 (-) Transcript_43473:116-1012(-)
MARRGHQALVQHLDKRLAGILLDERMPQLVDRHAVGHLDVARRLHAARHVDEVRREGDLHWLAGRLAQALLNLRHVAVLADAVAIDALCNLAVQVGLLGGASGARHAALGVDDDVLRSDEASLEQRVQRQLGARRVAARVGQQAGALDLLAPKLRDAVHRLLLQLHRRMLMPVPLCIQLGIAKAEVRRQVNNLQLCWQLRYDFLRGRVRKAAEDGIHVVVVDVGDLDKLGHVNRRHEVWEHLGKVLAGRAVARESCDLDVGVQRTQAHDLGAGIARCAEHGDLGDLTRRSLCAHCRAA